MVRPAVSVIGAQPDAVVAFPKAPRISTGRCTQKNIKIISIRALREYDPAITSPCRAELADIPLFVCALRRPVDREHAMTEQASISATKRRSRRQLLTGGTGALAAVLAAQAIRPTPPMPAPTATSSSAISTTRRS